MGLWEKLFGEKKGKEENYDVKAEDIEYPAEDEEFEDVYGKPQDFDAGEQPESDNDDDDDDRDHGEMMPIPGMSF